MIPHQLSLQNFLSYRDASLNFQGLHTACICGPNGAGKSSLLEAMAWAIWGQTRVAADDDIIHAGEMEARVDFAFQLHQQLYRVVRRRRRGQSSSLEFQVATNGANVEEARWRSLTEKGVRATQEKLLAAIKLDYETFVHSAYLRQGRADEFMLKRASARKQVLAELLKLDRYDELSELSKEKARQFKAEATLLERRLASLQERLQEAQGLERSQAEVKARIEILEKEERDDRKKLQRLQEIALSRQSLQQQMEWQRQQAKEIERECDRRRQEIAATQQQLQELEALLAQEREILAGYEYFQSLQAREEAEAAKFQMQQRIRSQCQQLQQQLDLEVERVKEQLVQARAQLDSLQQQERELQVHLQKSAEVDAALGRLQTSKERLHALDRLQIQVSPLLQRRQALQAERDRARAKAIARLEELDATLARARDGIAQQPKVAQLLRDVEARIAYLEKRRLRLQQVREKGMERRSFMDDLNAQQRECEYQLAELEQKLQLLRRPADSASAEIPAHAPESTPSDTSKNGKSVENGQPPEVPDNSPAQLLLLENGSTNGNGNGAASSAIAPAVDSLAETRGEENGRSQHAQPCCPLCDRPLDERHYQLVWNKTQDRQQEVRKRLWLVREQLDLSEREIQVFRQEYRQVERELKSSGELLERRGVLHSQFSALSEGKKQLETMLVERERLHGKLQNGIEPGVEAELQQIEGQLQRLDYDEQSHALARGEVERWRWAEIERGKIEQAQRKAAQILQQKPEVEATIAARDRRRAQLLQDSPLSQKIAGFERQTSEIGYDLETHDRLRQELRQHGTWQARYQELKVAKQQYGQVAERLRGLQASYYDRQQQLERLQQQIATSEKQWQDFPDCDRDIQALEASLHQRRQQLDEAIACRGSLQQQQQHLEELGRQNAEQQETLKFIRRQYRIYEELDRAFGKKGIQALTIENVLPQLEAEANRILARLSANQLHVQFVTQRSSRSASKKSGKVVDTLDIVIADASGTRPYETYSGGEAFRINFAIRLALARLLAQRSGTPLQMLVVDEGFGTQDREGCERLIAAINAIAPDFACILAVTHMPHIKAAFQTRIEVCKTEGGSQLSLYV